MPSGSCLCGNLKISYDDSPDMTALCHCKDCGKISGSVFSTNAVVKPETFKSSGTSKAYKKTADSGAEIISYFCPECGSTLWRESPTFGTNKVVKMGVLDDSFDNAKPMAELYAPQRASWVPQVSGTAEKKGMS